jgi:hypothetical protein
VTEPLSLPADVLLLRLSTELQRCRALVNRIEADLLPAVGAPGVGEAAQMIDLVDQSLEDLSLWLNRLVPTLPPELTVDCGPALAALRLGDLRLRLSGRAPPHGDGHQGVALF